MKYEALKTIAVTYGCRVREAFAEDSEIQCQFAWKPHNCWI